MSRSFLNHPLLKNPVKWIRGVDKKHSTDLYSRSFYDVDALKHNPFSNALSSTRSDVSKLRFPIGNMVQIIVGKQNGKYRLLPVLEKPVEGQHPASYVIASKSYIDFTSKKSFRPIPFKYRQRSPLVMSTARVSEEFSKETEDLYRNRVVALLNEVQGSDEHHYGILLRPAENAHFAWKDNKVLEVHTDLVSKDIFIPFEGNDELCSLVLALETYIHI